MISLSARYYSVRMEENSPVVIRQAAPRDNKAGSELVFSILRSYGIEPDINGFEADIAQLGLNQNPAIVALVAESEGEIAGVATLDLQDGETALFSGIYVDPKIRRRGIGKKLMHAIIESAKSGGCKKLMLETRECFSEAIKMYESAGWERGEDYPPGYGPERRYYFKITY